VPKLSPFRSPIVSGRPLPCGVGLSVCLGIVLVLLTLCGTSSPAYADVGVLLNESLDTSFARISGSGHSAIYFSRICAESPVQLRLCRPDEQGSVMSNYTTLVRISPSSGTSSRSPSIYTVSRIRKTARCSARKKSNTPSRNGIAKSF